MPSLSRKLAPGSEPHRKVVEAVKRRIDFSKMKMNDYHKDWQEGEKLFRAYIPETLQTQKVEAARRVNDFKMPAIVLPYSYAMLMTAHTYWTTVFLSRNPVFQYTARHGEGSQAVMAVEALIDYQVQVGEMMAPLFFWLLDPGQYGIGIVGHYWEEEYITRSRIVEQEATIAGVIPITGKKQKVQIREQVAGYVGNKLFNIRPYDFIPDPRVPLHDFQRGEFAGHKFDESWQMLRRLSEQGYYINVDELRKRRAKQLRDRDSSAAVRLPSDDYSYHESEIADTGFYRLHKLHCYIQPNEWGLGDSKEHELWSFTLDDSHELLIEARPADMPGSFFPYGVIQYEPDAYSLVSRSMMDVVKNLQQVMDWLVNSHVHSVRRMLNGKLVVDPLAVNMQDVLNIDSPVIRRMASSQGQPWKNEVFQLQTQDPTQNHLRDIDLINQFGQRATGTNDAVMGLQAPSSRRSATEFRGSMSLGTNRLKTNAEMMGFMGFSRLSTQLLQSTQANYDMEKQFRIVGDLAATAGPGFLNVTPDGIQGFFDYVPVDGSLPIDRFAQANLWREMMGQVRQIPEIAMQYDLGRMFAWVAQLAGMRNIEQFRIQVQPDAQVLQQQQAGNVTPLPGRGNAMGDVMPSPLSGMGGVG